MTKQQEVQQLEAQLMVFTQCIGDFGNMLNIDEARASEVKTVMMSMQRILEDCYNDLEKQVEYLKR